MHSHRREALPEKRDGRAAPARHPELPGGAVLPLLDLQATAGNAAVNRMVDGAGERSADTGIAERIQAAAGRGFPLPTQPRRHLERELGADLGAVRVHHDQAADSLARAVQAQAFTTGSDIFLRTGAYNPSTPGGLHLLAHEAVHTVQQRQGPVAGSPAPGGVTLSDPSDRFERAAEATADAVVSRLVDE